MSIQDDAKTFVKLIRAQAPDGALLVDETAAVRLIATALQVAEDGGVIIGLDRMGAIADNALAKVA